MHPATTRLRSSLPASASLLVVGDRQLLGGVEQRAPGTGGLPSELLAQAGVPTDVDVAWDLRAALPAVANLSVQGRLRHYDAIVVVIPAAEVLPARRRLAALLAARRSAGPAGPPIVVVITTPAGGAASLPAATALIHQVVEAMPADQALAVLHAVTAPDQVLLDPVEAAGEVLDAAGIPDDALRGGAGSSHSPREVAVDRSLRQLQGHLAHLTRAVVLAQNSFGTPIAQLNLVSRGTLHSLAYVGRSSDGLEQTLSAAAVRSEEGLVIADTHHDPRCEHIPETRGPDAIRYYAGHPVHSDDGHRIGVLCVLDTRPRRIDPGDQALLRDLALLAEGELAALSAPPSTSD